MFIMCYCNKIDDIRRNLLMLVFLPMWNVLLHCVPQQPWRYPMTLTQTKVVWSTSVDQTGSDTVCGNSGNRWLSNRFKTYLLPPCTGADFDSGLALRSKLIAVLSRPKNSAYD